jgi:hypothetical protein
LKTRTRRLRVATDLHLEHVHRGPKLGAEQKVEDLAALRLGVVEQQPRAGARRQRAVAVVAVEGGATVEREVEGSGGGGGGRRQQERRGRERRQQREWAHCSRRSREVCDRVPAGPGVD